VTNRSSTNQQLAPQARVGITKQRALMLGNLCLFAGVYLLLYVGGLYATEGYNRLAARGDSDLPLLETAAPPAAAPIAVPPLAALPAEGTTSASPPAAAAPTQTAPMATVGEPVGDAPSASTLMPSTITRIVIPSIKVDSKVIEVGWTVQEQNGQQVAVWDVAKYAVGHHQGSANPGAGGNIVLAGHVGGYGRVFRDLFYVRPGEQITLYSAGKQFVYEVKERLLVTEEGVSAEQRAENARYIGAYSEELVTLVTCWPASGPDKFTQRVIVQARPLQATEEPLGPGW
jgi:sortase A